jgi:restriction system protein
MTPNRHSVAQELEALLLRLPWWAGLLCAFVTYLILRPIAGWRDPAATGTLDTALTAVGQLFVGLAGVAQYLIPLAFLALAAVAAFLHWKRRDIYHSLIFNPGGAGARRLSRDEVMLLVAAAYRARGFQVRSATAATSGRGFDLELRRGDALILLHLRHWKSSVLDAAPLLQLYHALEQIGADRVLILISGRFTPEAESFAADKPMDLIDGRGLKRLVTSRPSTTFDGIGEAIFGRLARRGDGRARDSAGSGRRWGPAADRVAECGADEGERTLGSALAALIREDPAPVGIPPDSVPASRRPPGGMLGPLASSAGAALTSQIHAPISVRRIANLIGMGIVLGAIWMTYQWFDALPEAPSHTPWALLGRHQSQPGKAYAELAAGLVAGEQALPPLGQLDYGPDPLPPKSVETIRGTETYREPPVEVFRSIRELEDAFNARYVPPPSCYDGSSPGGLASCGNHRIRARRAFMASNGRTMVPEAPSPPPPVASSYESQVTVMPADRDPAWETEPGWAQYGDTDADGYPEDLARETIGDWRFLPDGGDLRDTGPDSSGAESDAPQRPTSAGYWREEPGRGEWSGWVHREWTPGQEPPADSLPQGPSPRPSGAPEIPTLQRLPVEQWLPGERGSVITWREEQRMREQGMPEGAWNRPQTAEPSGDWRSPTMDGPVAEPTPDWRGDWSGR